MDARVIVFPLVYAAVVFHVHQGWLGNSQFIDPIYRKPSFARYSQTLCADFRTLAEEFDRVTNPQRAASKYFQQGRGITRDMLHTASLNYREGAANEANPSLAARASNRGLYHP